MEWGCLLLTIKKQRNNSRLPKIMLPWHFMEEKKDRKLADARSELRDRQDNQMEEIEDTSQMEEDDDMEVQPASLTVKEKQEVRDLVACLLKQRLGKLVNHVTGYLDSHGSMRNYMPVLHSADESMRFDVSPEAAAAVVTGFLKDLIAAGQLSEQMDFLAMDPNKLRRARQSVMTIDQGQGEGGGQGR